MSRKLVLYISCSLDGYIAEENDNLDFLNPMHKEGVDYGYADFISTIDTVIIGRKTYDWVMRQVDVFPHSDKKTYVITTQNKPSENNVHFYSGDLTLLLKELKSNKGNDIYCDGGAQLVNKLLQLGLIDKIILSIVPILLGNGTRLFFDTYQKQSLKLLKSQTFETGMVQLSYDVHKTSLVK